MTIAGGAGVSGLAAADVPALMNDYRQRAAVAAAQGECRAVDFAILAYTTAHGRTPVTVAELREYDLGEVAEYRIEDGRAVGPGCAEPAR
ncbi:hypothetical protein ACIA8K_20195 [Catenuloplanes sp. NPDC051500]|uniref:hypothetical protein n=1 Tax=Catenuloplanes sp. NPDC051500 TaxID=3363959 RepID=UPI003788E614